MSTCIYPSDFLSLDDVSNEEKEAKFPSKNDVQLRDFGEYGAGIITMRPFERGEIIGSFTGTVAPEIKQHTMQIDAINHIHDPYFIGYLLHNCDPNSVLDMHRRTAYCIKDIDAGKQVTIDYATTEDSLFLQFPCLCRAKNCRHWITGRNEKVSQDGKDYLSSLT